MKNNAIVGNIGHFDNEIDMAVSRNTQESRILKLSHKLTDSNSQMVTVLSFLLKVDFLTSVAPLVIHLSLCHALLLTKPSLKSSSGRTKTLQNTKMVKFTSYQRSLMRRSLCSIFQPSVPNFLSSPKSKLIISMSV